MSQLVERVLEFSKLEQGRRNYELESIDLADLVRETAQAFRRTLADKGFVFTVKTAPAPLWVRADSAAFEQVLVNLLDNAVKYSRDRRVIGVRTGYAGSEAFFEVTDSGIGIPPTDIGRIFDRFYRGANAAFDRRGFGLGLAIAHEIVRAHGGRIEVTSQPEHGTHFRVSLPLLREQRDSVKPVAAADVRIEHIGQPARGGQRS